MAYINCSNKSFLIVDNIKPSRDALKQYALSVSAKRIDSTIYPNDVISFCTDYDYDVIFLGYDLGEGQKNGQQLLEELKTNQLISRQCIVIIITAETSQAMVLAALEHKPDEYLAKPYTINELTKRLVRSSNKKYRMKDIYQALDNNDYQQVISLCKTALEKGTPHRLECLGIISRQYLELNEHALAKQIYLRNRDKPNCHWANIGLGKIALYENDIEGAIAIFKRIQQNSPCYLSTYDWLAKCYQLQEDFETAENILEQAVVISPRSVARLKSYADLCSANENFEKATHAYLETNNLAYNSIHHHPDNALNFAKSLTRYSSELSIQIAKRLNNKAFKALSNMTKEFRQIELKIQSNLLSACLFKNVKETRSSNEKYHEAKKQLTKAYDTLTPSCLIQMCKILNDLEDHETVRKILTHLIESCAENIEIMTEIDKLSDETLSSQERIQAQRTLNTASTLYKNKDYQEAIKKLKSALELFPEHLGIKLNLIQALLVSYQTISNAKDLQQAEQIINALDQCARNDTINKRYIKLKDKYEQLKVG